MLSYSGVVLNPLGQGEVVGVAAQSLIALEGGGGGDVMGVEREIDVVDQALASALVGNVGL